MQLSGTYRTEMLEALHSAKLIQKKIETIANDFAKANDIDLKVEVLDLDTLDFINRPAPSV